MTLTTTMQPRYFVLDKHSSSYTFHGSFTIRDVEAIPKTVQQLITSRLEWDSEASLDIRYYLSTEPFPEGSELKAHIERTVNDDYLERTCCERDLSELGRGRQQNVIVVAVGPDIEVNFHVFVRTGADEPATYAGCTTLRGDLGSIMDLVKKEAEEMAGEVHGMNVNPEVSSTRIYKPRAPFTEAHLQDFESKGELWRTSVAEHFEGVPEDGCWLILEIDVHQYKYVLFRKQDSRYIFSGPGSVNALPHHRLEVLVNSARREIEGPHFPATASISISVWAPSGQLRTRSPRDWEGGMVTAETFRKDLSQCSPFDEFRDVPRTLVIVFEVSSPMLETVPKEGHVIDREAVAKLARERESISTEAKLPSLLLTQRESREDAIYNNRPHQLVGPPVQVYHPVFAKFIQEISRPVKAGELTHEELDIAANFIYTSLDFFKDGSDRRNSLDKVKEAVGDEATPRMKICARPVLPGEAATFFCHSAQAAATVCIFELENEIGEGDSDPMMEAECRFVEICSLEEYKPFRDASCCPMFLVGVAGPNLAVSGAVFTERFVSQRFTDYIYLGPLPSGGVESPMSRSIRRVAQIFRALNICINELEDYYQSLEFRPPSASDRSPAPIPLHPISGKVTPPHFQAYTICDKRFKIEYTEHLAPLSPSRTVFKGTIECEGDEDKGKHDVVVKFTDAYCKEAHELLAKISLAPKLWFCNREESVGMYVVVMDHVRGEQVGSLLEDEAHINQLRMAMDGLHEAGYVHGDLRGPNLLIAKDGLKLVDLDWCGKAGEARYPASINVGSDIEWHKGVLRDGFIEKAHDEHMFNLLTVPEDGRGAFDRVTVRGIPEI